MQFISKAAALSALVAVMAACSNTPIEDPTPIDTIEAKEPAPIATEGRAVPTITPPVRQDPLQNPGTILSERSVYFDFDDYSIKSDFRAMVRAHAKYLLANPDKEIVIQGNTDERGGAEYNLALGQRRSDAVKTLMKALGVRESQVETISFGKEKPKAFGSNEAAWSENRRADIVYQ